MGPHPFELLRLLRLDESIPAPANIERHQQVEVGVEVARESQRCEALLLDDDSQFLLQLADQALLRTFAGFDLPARKLPQPCHRLALRALRDQHPAIRVDERGGGDQQNSHFYDR